MKKSIPFCNLNLLLVIFMFINTTLSAQQYSWAPNDAVWKYQRLASNSFTSGSYSIHSPQNWSMYSVDNSFEYLNYEQSFVSFPTNVMGFSEIFLFLGFHNGILYKKNLKFTIDDITGELKDDTIVNFNAAIGDYWHFYNTIEEGNQYSLPYDLELLENSGITTVLDTGRRVINGQSLKWIYVKHQKFGTNYQIDTNDPFYTDTIFELFGPKKSFSFIFNISYGNPSFACYSDATFGQYVENQTFCTYTASIEDHTIEESFSVYPNPCTNGVLYLSNTTNLPSTISIFNSLGTLVDKYELSTEINKSLAIDHLSSGVYIAVYQTASGYREEKKVVVL